MVNIPVNSVISRRLEGVMIRRAIVSLSNGVFFQMQRLEFVIGSAALGQFRRQWILFVQIQAAEDWIRGRWSVVSGRNGSIPTIDL